MIIFNSDFVLKQCLESIYPFANQILIAEGPVKYWQERGYTTSTDKSNDILHSFPDPEKKITIYHNQYKEKDDQCNAALNFLKPDNDYLFHIDADEIYRPEDLKNLFNLIEKEKYTSVGFKSKSFYGGFNHYITGFEENFEFLRLYKIYPGSTWLTHRPPIIKHTAKNILPEKHLNFNTLAKEFNIRLWHYSYVFPRQVYEKIAYYKRAVSKNKCIDNYFEKIYLPWVTGNELDRQMIEKTYEGVHEWKPQHRTHTITAFFKGSHPAIIERDKEILIKKFEKQLKEFTNE